MMRLFFVLFLVVRLFDLSAQPVEVGADRLFQPPYRSWIAGKRVGLVTNQTALTSTGEWLLDRCLQENQKKTFRLVAIFSPEHGLQGHHYAEKRVEDDRLTSGIPVHSLYGDNQRPTPAMLEGLDLLLFDIQDIGSRSYTYVTTLFYVMEEAAKHKIPVIVCDRPNPINGRVVDGPMLHQGFRSFVSYLNVPYCHGMTVGELARFFNEENNVGCDLRVVPMKGWKRSMSFQDTGLLWVPTSPQIPDPQTPLYYPATGILGELQIVNIGIGYTLPFRVVGAPWIQSEVFAKALNDQKFPGILFRPFSYRPFFGRYAHQDCHGVLLIITDPLQYKPVATQYLILGILKSLYPKPFADALQKATHRKEMFCKVNGTDEVWNVLEKDRYVVWKLRDLHKSERELFLQKRKRYLDPSYGA